MAVEVDHMQPLAGPVGAVGFRNELLQLGGDAEMIHSVGKAQASETIGDEDPAPIDPAGCGEGGFSAAAGDEAVAGARVLPAGSVAQHETDGDAGDAHGGFELRHSEGDVNGNVGVHGE